MGCEQHLLTVSGIATENYVSCVVDGVRNFPNKSSMYFDGSSDYLRRVDVSSDDIGSDINLTVNAWVKVVQHSVAGYRSIVDYQADTGAGTHLRFMIDQDSPGHNQSLMFESGAGTQHESVDDVWENDQWHMITVEVNNTEQKFYVDGSLKGNDFTDNATDLSSSLTADFNVAGVTLYKGYMRHVSIHETNLGSTVLQAMYNNGQAIDLRQDQGNYDQAGNLLHYWFLGDCDDLGPDGIRDRAGDLHLTASGSPLIVFDTPHRS